jgi:hypothetical protein
VVAGPWGEKRFEAGRRSKRWLAAAMLLACPAMAAPDEPDRTVVVVVPEAAAPLPLQKLVEALSSQLAELGVQVQLSTGPAGAGAPTDATSLSRDRDVLAFVWIERTVDALVVHFYEPAGRSLRERRIPVTGTDAASIEEVAVVVRSAASALVERADGRSTESTRPVVSRPAPRPLPPTPAATARGPSRPSETAPPPFQASLGYAGTLYARDSPWQHGVMGSIAWRAATTPWRVGAAYSWFSPIQRRTDELRVALYRHPIELFFGLEVPVFGPRVSLRAEGAGIADPIVRRTSRVLEGLESTPSTTRWSWALSTRLRFAWEPTAPLWLFFAGGADFLLNRFEHVVQTGEQNPVLTPLLARPCLQVGAAADFP